MHSKLNTRPFNTERQNSETGHTFHVNVTTMSFKARCATCHADCTVSAGMDGMQKDASA